MSGNNLPPPEAVNETSKKKSPPVIELLEDGSILIVTNPREKTLPLENIPQLLPKGILQRIDLSKKSKPREKLTQPANWIMPPQPEAYIKYPRYDFL